MTYKQQPVPAKKAPTKKRASPRRGGGSGEEK
jgi:hypothetical protein